jgi:PhnB protein
MAEEVSPIPRGYHSVTRKLIVRDAAGALEYYKKAFGAEVTSRHDRPDGNIMHATIKIGDSVLMLADECPPHEGHEQECVRSPADLQGTTTNFYLYMEDVDAVFGCAIEAGGREAMPVSDMFWGDRCGMLRDPFGHFWTVATHTEDVGEEELERRAQEFFAHQPA